MNFIRQEVVLYYTVYTLDLRNAGQVWIFDPRSVKRGGIYTRQYGEMSSGVQDWRRAVYRAENIKRSDKRSCPLVLGLWILPLKLPPVGFNPQKTQSMTENRLISIKTPHPTKFWKWKKIIQRRFIKMYHRQILVNYRSPLLLLSTGN